MHLAGERLARTSDAVSPLLLLLRKYVRDGRLVSVSQPPWERVLSLGFEKRDDDGTLLESRLIIEIMGRHSNIVLVGAGGKVLDSAKRVGHEISRQRTVLPGQPYTPPPPAEQAVYPWRCTPTTSGASVGRALRRAPRLPRRW